VFRRIFGVPANAASQLRAVLPSGIADRLDLGRLAPVPGSFVDEDLRWRHSDVLFTAPLDGRDAFVYVLVEHQSSDDPLMAFRVLRLSLASAEVSLTSITRILARPDAG
jgi:predicted transposase/invertase (TIGR01784 family)